MKVFKTYFKGTVAQDDLTKLSYNFFILVQLQLHLRIRRVRQDCSTIYEDFNELIFQPCEMAYYINALREQNAQF
jgi:hypothetical protein